MSGPPGDPGREPRRRFTETAEDYDRWRPGYPPALADWLVGAAGLKPGSVVVDVGCGTGISTRLFAERGFEAVGVDPNEAMLERARRHGGRARYARGDSAATGLPPGGADLVFAAQAFHWFPLRETLAEFARLLRPGGLCAAFWNTRAEGPFMDAYEGLLLRYSEEYAGLPSPERTLEDLRRSPGVRSPEEAEFPNGQRLDRAGFLGRVRSSSYVAHGVRDRKGFEAALDRLFDAHQEGGRVAFEYRVRALCWRPG